MPEFSYTFHALFAAFRISVWFWLLFVVIAPLFLKHIRGLPQIEKMIHAWIGLGGTILVSVFVLVTLNIYDFISIVLVLLLIPLIVDLLHNRKMGIKGYFKQVELKTIVSHVRFIESDNKLQWKRLKPIVKKWLKGLRWANIHSVGAFAIALMGSLIRMFSALENAAPFSRNWYIHLNRIKNLHLQQYFDTVPEPAGMHSLVSVFSMLTQVSPEMILHLVGALTSFFLCLIIYWATKDITKNKYPLAPVFAMSIYALVPMLFLPLSLDQQIEANSLDLALCFAIPTITLFVRYLRGRYSSPLFYIIMGFVGTGLTNLFVAFVILFPLAMIALLVIPRKKYLSSVGRNLLYLVGIAIVIVLPFVTVLYINDLNMLSFYREQLYNTRVYSYHPLLLADLSILSKYYLATSVALLTGNIIRYYFSQQKRVFDEIVILTFLTGLSLIYIPRFSMDYALLDPDQLNAFYALLISILFGILFANVMDLFNWIVRYKNLAIKVIESCILIIGIGGLLYIQGGLQVSRVLPSTLPNGFFEAYYEIIEDHLPYSYAIVGPDIDRTLSKNRHYFMSYDYFLNHYGSIDSLYHQWLSVPEQQRSVQEIPPPSIFVFVEKSPYGDIQQGILYNSGSVMRDVEQWLTQFKELENRTLNTYYDSKNVAVYEIVNREGESALADVLLNVQPADSRRKE